MTRVVFLVPRRNDNGPRDRIWQFCRARWENLFPDWPVIEGHHNEGPFSRAYAANLAADLADDGGRWDVAIVIDSDVMLRRSAVAEAVERSLETGLITWPHTRWRGISELWTKRMIDDRHDFGPEIDHDDMDVLTEKTNPLSWSCCIVIPRAAWERLGGFDERFRGWGYEDMAFQSAVVGLLGYERLPVGELGQAGYGRTDVFHFWHPRSGERIAEGKPGTTASKEYVENARLGRRYMVALRRDHNRHDRPGPGWADSEEQKRDIANLMKDEAKFAGVARMHGLPDYTGWWPSLEELIDGAKEARKPSVSDVALIVRTGGKDETWETRSGYLRRSLESLTARVSGPISRRVIYSDWSDRFRPELDVIAHEFGFYVVGEGNHGYAPAVRRLFGYIRRRVTEPYVFLVEDDFLYLRDVNLEQLARTLTAEPYIAQLALLRGPCYPREQDPKKILGWDPKKFERLEAGTDRARLEHRLFWTMNPSLMRASIADVDWPLEESSERRFGDRILRDPRVRFAFAGEGEPWIDHIGEVRSTDAY